MDLKVRQFYRCPDEGKGQEKQPVQVRVQIHITDAVPVLYWEDMGTAGGITET